MKNTRLFLMVLALFSLLLSACTKPEVDYRDKWIGKYEYTNNQNDSGILKVTKVGDNKIDINVVRLYGTDYITVEHDGSFRGRANSATTSYGTLEGQFYGADSLVINYYHGMGHNAPFRHVTYIAKKINSSL